MRTLTSRSLSGSVFDTGACLPVGISFSYLEGDLIDVAGLSDRLKNRESKNEFEKLLISLDNAGDRLVLRVQPLQSSRSGPATANPQGLQDRGTDLLGPPRD